MIHLTSPDLTTSLHMTSPGYNAACVCVYVRVCVRMYNDKFHMT